MEDEKTIRELKAHDYEQALKDLAIKRKTKYIS